MFYNKEFYASLSEKIDYLDYSSYTFQYPPPFLGENDFNNTRFIESFSDFYGESGLYIHIPFCDTKCTFCRYFSIIDKKEEVYDRYTEYLIKELTLYKDIYKGKINSLYFGGGTPSLIQDYNIEKILSFIYANFTFTDNFQFCFEVNPSSVTFEKIKILKKYNCNRLTIGVQTLDEKVLKQINRNQTLKDVIQTIYFSKKVGIDYVNVDLMLGIKGQTIESFLRDIQYIIKLNPDLIHLHGYETTKRVIDNNIFNTNALLKSKMASLGSHLVKKSGYFELEGDAFGKKQDSKNQQLYNAQLGGNYMGIGVSSVGYNGMYRYINHDTLDAYYDAIEKGQFPIKFASFVSEKAKMIQYVIYNMRYQKIDLVDFSDKFGVDFFSVFGEIYDALQSHLTVYRKGDFILFEFNQLTDYVIYSKYFYEDSIIDFYKKKYEL